MKTIALLLCSPLAMALEGSGWQVDQPDQWADPMASHHGKHAILGAIAATPCYVGLRLLKVGPGASWTAGTALAGVVGIAWELQGAADGAYRDPVDVAWTLAGGALASTLCYATDRWLIMPEVSPDGASLTFAATF
jgi:hypothetical protein